MDTFTTSRREKLGRNDPCWCGSGSKYKKCHEQFDKSPPLTKEQYSKLMRDIIGLKIKTCLHPNTEKCSDKIIAAHSIQRSGGLSRIALRGEVYCFHDNMRFLMGSEQLLKPELVGCKNASTFTGFCGYHDNEIFKPIDTEEFTGLPKQIILLAYRAFCRELLGTMRKQLLLPMLFKLANRKSRQEQQKLISGITEQQLLNKYNLSQCIQEKSLFDGWLTAGDFSNLDYYIIQFDLIPNILCSAYLQPWSDFDGIIIQKLPDIQNNWQSLSCTTLANECGGTIVFSWIKDQAPAAVQFIRSLNSIPNSKLTDAVIRFAFEYSDNVCLSPVWWDRLSQNQRAALVLRMRSGLGADRHKDCLKDDGLNYADWKVAKRITNIDI